MYLPAFATPELPPQIIDSQKKRRKPPQKISLGFFLHSKRSSKHADIREIEGPVNSPELMGPFFDHHHYHCFFFLCFGRSSAWLEVGDGVAKAGYLPRTCALRILKSWCKFSRFAQDEEAESHRTVGLYI